MIIGRLAPSPTGAQHLGNARTYLIAWLLNRRAGGRLILRIEDLDTPRIKSWATQQAIDDLRWLGLDWDQQPGDEKIDEPRLVQTQRTERYRQILDQLKANDFVYPCTCSRSEIESVASAPHESLGEDLVYPGTCRERNASDSIELDRQQRNYAWRFRNDSFFPLSFVDQFLGQQTCEEPTERIGDFVVARANGSLAYQLAVVIDDHDMQINQVVRGNDLVMSTFRQLLLFRALGWQTPDFCHLPLVVGPDGRRLAKRHGDTRLSTLREHGIRSETIVGYLAWRSGIIEAFRSCFPRDLLDQNPLQLLTVAPTIFESDDSIDFFTRLQTDGAQFLL